MTATMPATPGHRALNLAALVVAFSVVLPVMWIVGTLMYLGWLCTGAVMVGWGALERRLRHPEVAAAPVDTDALHHPDGNFLP